MPSSHSWREGYLVPAFLPALSPPALSASFTPPLLGEIRKADGAIEMGLAVEGETQTIQTLSKYILYGTG